jgi:RNA polymerase sigma-70 factor (ECF subfamily)
MTTSVAVCGPCLPTPNLTDETELIAGLKAGGESAYKELFRRHSGAMLAVARRYFGDSDDAAEAVQDAFVSAFQAMTGFAGTSRLGTWLHRITVNACLMRLRSRRRSRLVPLGGCNHPVAAAEADGMTRAETVARVRAGIARLPDAYRAVVQLRDIDGIDTAAAATRLGTNEGVVKVRLHRARQALKAVLEQLPGMSA